MNNSYLTALFEEIGQISQAAQASFGKLSAAQLNWQPEPGSWSIAQCLDHLIISNKSYFPTLVQLADGTKRPRKREKVPFLPSVWGNWLQRSMSAVVGSAQKAPDVYLPASETIGADILVRFEEHQLILQDLIEKTDQLEHGSVVITSPVNRLMTFSLKNACQLLIQHEKRHLSQAQRLLNLREFPQKATS